MNEWTDSAQWRLSVVSQMASPVVSDHNVPLRTVAATVATNQLIQFVWFRLISTLLSDPPCYCSFQPSFWLVHDRHIINITWKHHRQKRYRQFHMIGNDYIQSWSFVQSQISTTNDKYWTTIRFNNRNSQMEMIWLSHTSYLHSIHSLRALL